jgi:hypothetical protein
MPPVDEIAGRIAGPAWAVVEGYEVRTVAGAKRYRCPWCQGSVEPGTVHAVAFLAGHPEERRHYHSGCWGRYLESRRHRPGDRSGPAAGLEPPGSPSPGTRAPE